jgi:hypothetical protein
VLVVGDVAMKVCAVEVLMLNVTLTVFGGGHPPLEEGLALAEFLRKQRRTFLPFHGGNTGSIPVGATMFS